MRGNPGDGVCIVMLSRGKRDANDTGEICISEGDIIRRYCNHLGP
jgi:hypothetical protein